ncbi:hypothetical protein [Poseidonibacter antarcticus]|uniref:hypothetical protein n=1 Tax=Poseidonibacter antarcticus TaxID=2478538 RepID=UPI000EF44692|nr:hypothetical protein [Poseidonibacter antarcticus]
MFANIWVSSALIVTLMFSAGAMYKSYSDVQEAKQVQEHYEIVSKIKTTLAKQYNKNPEEITREEIIAFLPDGGNWDKVLLLDRNSDSSLDNEDDILINEDGNIEINEDEKLKLLALRAKLKDIINLNEVQTTTKNEGTENEKTFYTFEIGKNEKNNIINDIEIEKALTRAVDYLAQDILYDENSSSFDKDDFDKIIEELTPYDNIYLFDIEEALSDDDTLTEDKLKDEKENHFKKMLKEKLKQNELTIETKLYEKVKGYL